LFVLTGSAGSGKSAALRELAVRRPDLVAVDSDDWAPPPEQLRSWWEDRLDACVRDAVASEGSGRHTVLAGWITRADALRTPAASELEGLAICLLDCADSTRVERIERRAASGTWGIHRPEQVPRFLKAAAEMRAAKSEWDVTLDTSHLGVPEVAGWVEGWIIEHSRSPGRGGRA
jgi:hypothetical protein